MERRMSMSICMAVAHMFFKRFQSCLQGLSKVSYYPICYITWNLQRVTWPFAAPSPYHGVAVPSSIGSPKGNTLPGNKHKHYFPTSKSNSFPWNKITPRQNCPAHTGQQQFINTHSADAPLENVLDLESWQSERVQHILFKN